MALYELFERYTHRHWAREQIDEPCSNAAVYLLSLCPSSGVPPRFHDYLPASKRPAISDVLKPTHKGRLHAKNKGIGTLVRQLDPPPPTLDVTALEYVQRNFLVTNQLVFMVPFLCGRGLCKRVIRSLRAIYAILARYVCWNAFTGGLIC